MALTFSNPVNYSIHATTNFQSVKLVSGVRTADGTAYQLLEATMKNTGAIVPIRISNKLTIAELKGKKEELVLAYAIDDQTAETFPIVYLRGERVEEDF